MGFHLLCSDGAGRCLIIFGYIFMTVSNCLIFITVVYPELGGDKEKTVLIEYTIYCIFWSMMLISHLLTMCVDPGFIPKHYEYNTEQLTGHYLTIRTFGNKYRDR